MRYTVGNQHNAWEVITILRPETTGQYSRNFSCPKYLCPFTLSNLVSHHGFSFAVTAVHEMILSNYDHSNISTIRNWGRSSNVERTSNNIMPIHFFACDFFTKKWVVEMGCEMREQLNSKSTHAIGSGLAMPHVLKSRVSSATGCSLILMKWYVSSG